MPNVGIAELDVERRADGRSVVVKQFGKAPVQVHRPLYLDGALDPTVFLRSPSAGLLDGDEHRIFVAVRSKASLELRTQAACVVYPGRSEQTISIDIESGGSFFFRPHPFILNKGAQLKQTVIVRMASDASLVLSDSWCAGRVAMKNEIWEFDEFDNCIEIFVAEQLVYREHFHVKPQTQFLPSRFLCGEYSVLESLHVFGPSHQKRIDSLELMGDEIWQSTRHQGTIRRALRK